MNRQQNILRHSYPQPQLFEDTSQDPYSQGYYDQQNASSSQYIPQPPPPSSQQQPCTQDNLNFAYSNFAPTSSYINNPVVADVAMQYGSRLLGDGSNFVDEKIDQYVRTSKIKYYFAVDTTYVLQKLKLMFFPFFHSDWSIKYDQEDSVQPRHEVNAPDLYIPLMAFVTYVLVAGFCLGLQSRFSPDVLGLQASSAIVYLVLEICFILVSLYVTAIQSRLKTFDILAFSSYKYVGMIMALLSGILTGRFGYYCVLIYCSSTLMIFLFCTLRWRMQTDGNMRDYSIGNKRRLYLLFLITVLQPFMMWWLTYQLLLRTAKEL